MRRGNVDFKMGLILTVGGFVGSSLGVVVFTLLRSIGQVDLLIRLSYVAFLGTVGVLMVVESLRALLRRRGGAGGRGKLHQHTWLHGLPLKMRFRRSRLYISALLPLGIGVFVGLLAAIMGVGGGFIMVPAMIYLLGMPTAVVVGTSLFQIIFVTANVTLLQAINNQTVDILLALILLTGAVVGAQVGTKVGAALRARATARAARLHGAGGRLEAGLRSGGDAGRCLLNQRDGVMMRWLAIVGLVIIAAGHRPATAQSLIRRSERRLDRGYDRLLRRRAPAVRHYGRLRRADHRCPRTAGRCDCPPQGARRRRLDQPDERDVRERAELLSSDRDPRDRDHRR